MIVYSVASRQSFEMVSIIRDKILNHLVSLASCCHSVATVFLLELLTPINTSQGSDWVPFVIIGNKSDLKPEQRHVSLEEGRQLGEEFHCAFTEASARLDYNVTKAFDLMIREIEKSQASSQPMIDSKCAVM
jgi:Ras homolog enriched in brain